MKVLNNTMLTKYAGLSTKPAATNTVSAFWNRKKEEVPLEGSLSKKLLDAKLGEEDLAAIKENAEKLAAYIACDKGYHPYTKSALLARLNKIVHGHDIGNISARGIKGITESEILDERGLGLLEKIYEYAVGEDINLTEQEKRDIQGRLPQLFFAISSSEKFLFVPPEGHDNAYKLLSKIILEEPSLKDS